jgi:hypothetical protein
MITDTWGPNVSSRDARDCAARLDAKEGRFTVCVCGQEEGNIMSAISGKVGELGAAIGLLAIGFLGCSANDERTGGSEVDVATTEEALTKNIHWCAQYEAEAMTRIGLTGTTSGGITLFSNTSALQQVHSFDPGPQLHGIGVYARGTPAGGIWPKMRLRVDGAIQGPNQEVTVDSSSYNIYLFFYTAPTTIGNHTMRIEYTNDGIVNGVDRNLHIDGINLACPIGVRCGTGFCDTNGTGNVCCMNQDGTNPVCQSEASCLPPRAQIHCDNHQECPDPYPAHAGHCTFSSTWVGCTEGHLVTLDPDKCHWPGCVCKSPGMAQEKGCALSSWACVPANPTLGGGWKICQPQ